MLLWYTKKKDNKYFQGKWLQTILAIFNKKIYVES